MWLCVSCKMEIYENMVKKKKKKHLKKKNKQTYFNGVDSQLIWCYEIQPT